LIWSLLSPLRLPFDLPRQMFVEVSLVVRRWRLTVANMQRGNLVRWLGLTCGDSMHLPICC
jgi:hypothetical protein